MRLIATLVMLLAFLFTAPGSGHAADARHAHEEAMGLVHQDDHGGPTGKNFMDCHHGCSHSHVASPLRLVRAGAPVIWTQADFRLEDAVLPPTADLSPPYKPPRA
jgi:hypothetical protein